MLLLCCPLGPLIFCCMLLEFLSKWPLYLRSSCSNLICIHVATNFLHMISEGLLDGMAELAWFCHCFLRCRGSWACRRCPSSCRRKPPLPLTWRPSPRMPSRSDPVKNTEEVTHQEKYLSFSLIQFCISSFWCLKSSELWSSGICTAHVIVLTYPFCSFWPIFSGMKTHRPDNCKAPLFLVRATWQPKFPNNICIHYPFYSYAEHWSIMTKITSMQRNPTHGLKSIESAELHNPIRFTVLNLPWLAIAGAEHLE